MKKTLKITGIIIGLILLLLALTPFFLKGTIEDLLKKNINKNINASVSWEKLDISLLRSFPDAAVIITDFSIVNKGKFSGDTLASGSKLQLDMEVKQLFKNDKKSIVVDALYLYDALINIQVDSLGNTNYNIAKSSEDNHLDSEDETLKKTDFSFALNHYEINNSRINYHDASSKKFLTLTKFNHHGNGDFSLDVSELDTKTSTLASFKLDNTEYLSNNSIVLDAAFQLDLKNQKYTFLENQIKINELPLHFDGSIQLNEEHTNLDLTFKTPSSDFKNFLAVIPKEYVKNLDGVTTTGNFSINGKVNGTVDETYIPKMDIQVVSNNASFKYPDLPKTVKNISLNIQLKNNTGLLTDTYLQIGNMSFKIDEQIFKANGNIKHITDNALIDLALKGTFDLANIEKVLPVNLEQDLKGIFNADLQTTFDMQSIDKEQYQNIKTDGIITLSDFIYTNPSFKNPLYVNRAKVTMTTDKITLNTLKASSGQTDVNAFGDIQNLIPWIMSKQDLKGQFKVTSDTFNVNDFMIAEVSNSKINTSNNNNEAISEEEVVKIPNFLNATLDFSAKKVIYDNLELTNTSGNVKIVDETAQLSNVTSKILGGSVAFSGDVNTKEDTPVFNMDLDLQKIGIDESFQKLSILKYIAPIANALEGSLSTKLSLKGKLNTNLTPNLATLKGNALAKIPAAKVTTEKTPLLSKLNHELNFLNLDKFSLNDISTAVSFNDGKIEVKPFHFKIEEIKVIASGSHGIEKNLDYKLMMDIPAKYLGSDITHLLSKLDPKEREKMSISVPVGVSGSFTNPKIAFNTKDAVKDITQRIIAKQKETLVNKGTDILKDIIGEKEQPKEGQKPNNTTEKATEVVKDVFNGIFGKKNKKD